jgi:endonuclease YncB( thermonuclease family)
MSSFCIRQIVAVATLQALAAVPALAGQAFKGTVVHVADGDTITVLHAGKEEHVRLTEIDCPERRQAFGRQARAVTTALTLGQEVTVVTEGRDRDRRTLGEVLLPDGRSLNRTLVREGWAWQFVRYSKDRHLAALEAEARAARRGIWADPHPSPPWEYRKAARVR